MENDNSAYWANRCAAYDTEKEELIQWQRNEIQTLQGSCQRLSYNLSMQQSIIAHNFEAVVRATVDPRSGQCSSSVLLQYLSQVKGGLVGMDMSVNNNNNINNNNNNNGMDYHRQVRSDEATDAGVLSSCGGSHITNITQPSLLQAPQPPSSSLLLLSSSSSSSTAVVGNTPLSEPTCPNNNNNNNNNNDTNTGRCNIISNIIREKRPRRCSGANLADDDEERAPRPGQWFTLSDNTVVPPQN